MDPRGINSFCFLKKNIRAFFKNSVKKNVLKADDKDTYVTDGMISTARAWRLIMVSRIVMVAMQPLNPCREIICKKTFQSKTLVFYQFLFNGSQIYRKSGAKE